MTLSLRIQGIWRPSLRLLLDSSGNCLIGNCRFFEVELLFITLVWKGSMELRKFRGNCDFSRLRVGESLIKNIYVL